jgi:uncharacterized protein YjaZ
LAAYWNSIKAQLATKGTFLESLVNEGQADEFAKSVYTDCHPSWYSFAEENEKAAWEKYRAVLYNIAGPGNSGNIFGDEKSGIPRFAGYYFGCRIVRSFMDRNPGLSFEELMKIPHDTIYKGSDLY